MASDGHTPLSLSPLRHSGSFPRAGHWLVGGKLPSIVIGSFYNPRSSIGSPVRLAYWLGGSHSVSGGDNMQMACVGGDGGGLAQKNRIFIIYFNGQLASWLFRCAPYLVTISGTRNKRKIYICIYIYKSHIYI